MSGLRFKVGELARLMVTAYTPLVGEIVEIESVGPFPKDYLFPDGSHSGYDADYTVICRGVSCTAVDHLLAKIDPPSEPTSLTRKTGVECEA